MKTLCEDHPWIGESELKRNQCPRCVADLQAQVAQLTGDYTYVVADNGEQKGMIDRKNALIADLQAQVATLTEANETHHQLTQVAAEVMPRSMNHWHDIARAALAQQPERVPVPSDLRGAASTPFATGFGSDTSLNFQTRPPTEPATCPNEPLGCVGGVIYRGGRNEQHAMCSWPGHAEATTTPTGERDE